MASSRLAQGNRVAVLVAGLLAGAPAPVAAQAGSPAGSVPVERLAARRAALLERLGEGVAVVAAGELRSIERDYPQDSDYRESNDFFYLTGLEAPGGRLVLVARNTAPDSAILYLPEPAGEREGSRLSGIADVRPIPADTDRMTTTHRGLRKVPSRSLAAELSTLRQVKDGEEIRRLRKAVAITGRSGWAFPRSSGRGRTGPSSTMIRTGGA